MNKLTPLLGTTLGAALSTYLIQNETLVRQVLFPRLTGAGYTALVIVMATLSGALLQWIISDLPRRHHVSRRLVDRSALTEGWWTQRLQDGKSVYYTLFAIHYAPDTETYVMKGDSFHTDGTHRAHFDSTAFHIDSRDGRTAEVLYAFDANMRVGPPRSVQGVGVIQFDCDTRGRLTHGTGWVLHEATGSRKMTFDIKRVEKPYPPLATIAEKARFLMDEHRRGVGQAAP